MGKEKEKKLTKKELREAKIAKKQEAYDAKHPKQARKRELYEAKKGKKKRKGCCFKCCLASLSITIVMLGAGIGIGWYFGNRFLQEKYDVSLSDCFGALKRFNSDKKGAKKVTNGFSAGDEEQFLDSVGEAVFLEDITADDVKDILTTAAFKVFDITPAEPEQTQNTLLAQRTDEEDDGDDIKTVLQKKISELFAQKFNPEKLADFEIDEHGEDNASEFYAQISDKSLAAFLNNLVLETLFTNLDIRTYVRGEVEEELDGGEKFIDLERLDFRNLLQIKQITFYKDESGAAHMRFTTKTNLKAILKTLKINGKTVLDNNANSFLKASVNVGGWFGKQIVKMLTPNALYLDVDMPITRGDGSVPMQKAKISLNGTTQSDFELVSKIFPELNDAMDNFFGEDGKVMKAVDKLEQSMHGQTVENMIQPNEATGKGGNINCDMVAFALEVSGINKDKDDNQKITAADAYLGLKTFALMNAQTDMLPFSQYDPARFKPKTQVVDGKEVPVYDAQGFFVYEPLPEVTEMNEELLLLYEQTLMLAFSDCYGIKDSSQGVTFETMLDMILDGNAGADLFDPERIKSITSGEGQGVILDNKMMAAIVARRMDRFVGEVEDFDISTIKPAFISLFVEDETQSGGIKRNFMTIGVKINVGELIVSQIKESNIFVDTFLGLLSPEMLVVATIEITVSNDPEYEYADTQIKISSLSDNESTQAASIIDKLKVLELNGEPCTMQQYLAEMLTPVRGQINSMSESLGVSIADGGVVMPDMYQMMAAMLNKDKDESEHVTAADLEASMDLVLNLRDAFERDIADFLILYHDQYLTGNHRLIDEFSGKYALSGGITLKQLFDALENPGDDLLALVDTNRLAALASDPRGLEDLEVKIDRLGLADLILSAVDSLEGNESVKEYLNEDTLRGIRLYSVEEDLGAGVEYGEFIEITVEVKLEDMLTERKPEVEFFISIIDKLYLTLVVEITPNAVNPRNDLIINGDPLRTQTLIDTMNKLGADIAGTRDEILDTLGQNVTEMLNNISGSNIVSLEMETRGEEKILSLSDLFTAVSGVLSDGKAPQDVIAPQEIRNAVAYVYSEAEIDPNLDFKNQVYTNAQKTEYTHKDDPDNSENFGTVDFTQELLKAFEEKFAIKHNESPNYFSDLMSLFGVGDSGDLAFENILDASKIRELTFKDYEAIKLYLKDMEMAGMLYEKWDEFIGNQLTKDALQYVQTFSEDVSLDSTPDIRNFVKVGIQITLGDYINDAAVLRLLPQTILIAVAVDITVSTDPSFVPVSARFYCNSADGNETDGLLDTIKKLGVDIDFDDIAQLVRDAFGDLNDKIGIEFSNMEYVDGEFEPVVRTDGIMILPNVFDMFYRMQYADKEDSLGQPLFENGRPIQNALRGLYINSDAGMAHPEFFEGRDYNPIHDYGQGANQDAIISGIIADSFAGIGVGNLPFDIDISDRKLGGIMAAGLDFGSGIVSFNILAAGDPDRNDINTRAGKENAWLENYKDPLDFDSTYISITVEIVPSELAENNDAGFEQILDEIRIFATVLLRYDPLEANDEDKFACEWFRINQMSAEDEESLFKLFLANTGEIEANINQNAGRCSAQMVAILDSFAGAVADLPIIGPLVDVGYGFAPFAEETSCGCLKMTVSLNI